jgi:hypothetical protein
MTLVYDYRKGRAIKKRGHRRSREAKGKQAKVAICMTCPEKEKDARSEPNLWEKDLDQIQLPTYLAVGFLTKETSEYIALSQGFLPKADIIDENVYRNILFIPKAVITKTMEVKV